MCKAFTNKVTCQSLGELCGTDVKSLEFTTIECPAVCMANKLLYIYTMLTITPAQLTFTSAAHRTYDLMVEQITKSVNIHLVS